MTSLKQVLKRPPLRALALSGNLLRRVFEKPYSEEKVCRVLVLQLGGIGDVLRIFPLIRALEAHFPGVELTTLTSAPACLFELLPGSDAGRRHIQLPADASMLRKVRLVLGLRRLHLDLVVNTTRGDGMIECDLAGLATGARVRIGFFAEGAGAFHTVQVRFDFRRSILMQNLDLLRTIGIDPGVAKIELALSERAREGARVLLRDLEVERSRLVAVHPWASSHPQFREWPTERYARLLERLVGAGYGAVLLGSPDEVERSQELRRRVNSAGLIDLTGKTGIHEVAAIIERCGLFVGNDSSLLHLAEAVGARSVAVFGGTSAEQVLAPGRSCTVLAANLPCQPCYRHQPLFDYRCDHGFLCLRSVSVDEVEEALKKS